MIVFFLFLILFLWSLQVYVLKIPNVNVNQSFSSSEEQNVVVLCKNITNFYLDFFHGVKYMTRLQHKGRKSKEQKFFK